MFVSPPLSPADEALRDANAAARRGDLDAAREAARHALDLDASKLEAWFLLGNVALTANRFADAEDAFTQGAARAPKDSPTQAQFIALRARALVNDGKARDAVTAIRAALHIGIHEPPGLVSAATILSQAGLESEALPLLEEAVRLAPDDAAAWFGLGGLQQFFGDLKAAEASFERAITTGERTRNPVPMAPMSLARLRRWTKDDNHITRLEATQCRHSLDAACIAYALFKEYDDIGDRDAAWDALQHGSQLGGAIDPWSPPEDEAIEAAWRQHFPLERFKARDDRPRSGPGRIFVVGLPRSGTTLVERILAAHSGVQALGELKTFGLAVKWASGSTSPGLLDADTIAHAAKADPRDIAEIYTRETAYLHDGSAWTLDKLPGNHEYVGLIRLAFPDAIIVNVQRNPMDSLFGAYKLLFARAHRWSYTQDDLANHYHAYLSLMTWWRQCLAETPKPLIDVSLEAVIADPDAQIRRLLDATGLPFEDACLRPHEASGAVATASSSQVRSPINAEGVGVWRRYSAELEPLRHKLQGLGLVDQNGDPLTA